MIGTENELKESSESAERRGEGREYPRSCPWCGGPLEERRREAGVNPFIRADKLWNQLRGEQ